MAETLARFGRIDVLVNNASRAMAEPVEHIELDEYQRPWDLNVIAPLPFIAGYASTKFAL